MHRDWSAFRFKNVVHAFVGFEKPVLALGGSPREGTLVVGLATTMN